MWLVIAGIVLLIGGGALVVYAQTTATPNQVRPQPTNGVYVNVTGRGLVLATVDPATLILDTTGTTPVLRALPQSVTPPTINERHVTVKPPANSTTITVPDATFIPASLVVSVNGIVQSDAAGDDYTVAGTVLTFFRTFQAGDIVRLGYRF
jgi:hypothetical protein